MRKSESSQSYETRARRLIHRNLTAKLQILVVSYYFAYFANKLPLHKR